MERAIFSGHLLRQSHQSQLIKETEGEEAKKTKKKLGSYLGIALELNMEANTQQVINCNCAVEYSSSTHQYLHSSLFPALLGQWPSFL